jgi:hypothetical protein
MKTLWEFIDGHKTQVILASTLITGFLINRGWIQQDFADLILGLLALIGGGAVAHAEVKRKK